MLGQGLEVSTLGLGCMGMSWAYGATDDDHDESVRTIHHALDIGINFLDTADIYGPHTNEQLVGEAIAGRRDEVVLATKFGIVRAPGTSIEERTINGRPDYVRASCDASLQRLGVDHIDLYYQHRIDPDTPIEETVGALKALIEAGKIRHYGLSEASPETLRRAHAIHPVTALQSEYSLWTRDPEDGVLATTRELGIGFVPYSPLGRGFLSGALKSLDALAPDDYRRRSPRFIDGNFERNLALVEKVEEVAARKSITPAQLALAWLLARDDHIVPIPGTRRRSRLDENAGAIAVTLTPAELAELDTALPQAVGARYPEAAMRELRG
ncbi:aldo/keto reductase [Labrys okinawensis]|uniref:aldo/keto reductase n=1 Tax=Labrys okinawensis TaxID=346911 RepID=UPI0039BC5CE4